MAEQEKSQHQVAKEYWEGFPEAPYSTSFKWIDGNGFEQLTTVRSYGAKTLLSQVDGLIGEIILRGGTPTNQRPPAAPAPTMPPAAQQAMAEGDKATAQAIYDQDVSITPPPAGKEYLTMSICKIVVRPEPDGTYSLECYAPGHKWPDLKATKRKLEVVKGYIKHITSADASKPLELSVNAIAYYCEGKPKDNGGYWLDLYHLRLA